MTFFFDAILLNLKAGPGTDAKIMLSHTLRAWSRFFLLFILPWYYIFLCRRKAVPEKYLPGWRSLFVLAAARSSIKRNEEKAMFFLSFCYCFLFWFVRFFNKKENSEKKKHKTQKLKKKQKQSKTKQKTAKMEKKKLEKILGPATIAGL